MIPNFPTRTQPPFSNSCLPTCVLAVLDHMGVHAGEDEVSSWCGETPDGCDWYEAQEGLQEEFEVEDMEGAWRRIEEMVEGESRPVVVTIGKAYSVIAQEILDDHAVVIVGISARGTPQSVVSYMDPATGTIDNMPTDRFQFGWHIPGGRAFTLQ